MSTKSSTIQNVELGNGLLWRDIECPSSEDLDALASELGVSSATLSDAMEPKHLPKVEEPEGLRLVYLRFLDTVSSDEAITPQELTHKLVVIVSQKMLVTIHRVPLPGVDSLRTQVGTSAKNSTASAKDFSKWIVELIRAAAKSYDGVLDQAQDQLEKLEESVFRAGGAGALDLKDSYQFKRRAFVVRRILRATLEVLSSVAADAKGNRNFKRTQEYLERSVFLWDEIVDSTAALLSLQISLSSQKTNEAAQRTNEVVRVLTVFSVFLLPLNVITGIYGMNFQHMPELNHPYGYAWALGLMVATATSIYFWFRRKGLV